MTESTEDRKRRLQEMKLKAAQKAAAEEDGGDAQQDGGATKKDKIQKL